MILAEKEPDYSHSIVSVGLEKIREFTDDLVREGDKRGLIGPRETERIWTRHILACAIASPLFRESRSVVDLGSGAGLPGIIFAIMNPHCEFHLVEPMPRRVDWLNEEVSRLSLSNVSVHRSRAATLKLPSPVDSVTARALKKYSELIPMSVPHLAPGGKLLFLKGQSVEEEILAANDISKKYFLTDIHSEEFPHPEFQEPTRVLCAQFSPPHTIEL